MPALQRTLSSFGLSPGATPVAAVQNWRILGLFNLYRLAVASAAVGISVTVRSLPPFGESSPLLFESAAIAYFALALIGVQAIRSRWPDFEVQVSVFAFADVALLTLLMHASGGLSSGLGLLLIVAIAGGSLILGKRVSIFYAALATVAAILSHSWELLTEGAMAPDRMEGYPQVGILGVGLFATAFLGYTLASRLRATEALAERRGVDLASLAQINEIIIQRMQSGVLACDHAGDLRFLNQAAHKFLGLRALPDRRLSLSEVSPDLAIQLFQWLNNAAVQGGRKPLVTRAGYTLLPRFVPLGSDKEAGALIFLDDMAALKQQAQQLKMAALARLTASIAHEIRNPLGAITNAAQLLGETVPDDGEQRRLTKIIEEQGRRMNAIIENVTQLSRRDRINAIRLELGSWAREFIALYCESVRVPREVFSQVGPGVEVLFDPDQLSQVITNLSQNALRHSPPFTGMPLIKLLTGTDTEGRPFLEIVDWGTGVPAAVADNIFDPFFTTTPKGTGLGLYIAKELCEGNGASLDYHPGEGGVGSRFRITMARPDDVPAQH